MIYTYIDDRNIVLYLFFNKILKNKVTEESDKDYSATLKMLFYIVIDLLVLRERYWLECDTCIANVVTALLAYVQLSVEWVLATI